ncbi:uncharacterized protein BXZ73DRAFT_81101 [Epithele typhae]|uniref:uncharacterized protein n=1 Tax=Epithele typhae TaxID=378194 RepID=UPI002007FFBE|nr:uncharacterized protein BXZ73DRAFT_81101 [Epithele typhae]KAH9916419.1 hypothetical protein BXZ73DRAFT_81101 [Epithele typhae]
MSSSQAPCSEKPGPAKMTVCGAQPMNEVDEKPPRYQAHDNLTTTHTHVGDNICIVATAAFAPSAHKKPCSTFKTIWRGFHRAVRRRESCPPVEFAVHVVVTTGATQLVGTYLAVPPEVIGVVPYSVLHVLIALASLKQGADVFGPKFWHTLVDAFERAQRDGSVPRLEAALLKCYYDWRLNFSDDAFKLVHQDGSTAKLEAALLMLL